MKHHLYRVKVRRILGQVSEACTDSLDCVLHTSNLVEGHVVDHHNVPPLECWDQTLLYVSQEGLAIHGSFDQHRRHNAGLTQASDERHRLPVAHRCIADQALATPIPTIEPHHVGGHCRFTYKYEVGRFKKSLLANLPRMLLQGRSSPSARHRFVSPVFAKALHPPDRRTGADLELFRGPTSRSSSFHEVYDARSQLTRIRSMHWLALRRINALDSLFRCVLGIPVHSGRDVL